MKLEEIVIHCAPRNDLLLVEKLPEKKEVSSGIILGENLRMSSLIRLKVLKVGDAESVKDIHINDIVWAEDIVQPILNYEKNFGLINQKYIHMFER